MRGLGALLFAAFRGAASLAVRSGGKLHNRFIWHPEPRGGSVTAPRVDKVFDLLTTHHRGWGPCHRDCCRGPDFGEEWSEICRICEGTAVEDIGDNLQGEMTDKDGRRISYESTSYEAW